MQQEARRRYWVRDDPKLPWQEITLEEFIVAERDASFKPKSGDGLATSGFSTSDRGEGSITYNGEIPPDEGEFEERAQLIKHMLDAIYPIPQTGSREDRESIDAERQALVLKTGWGKMPIEDLRRIASQ